MFISMNLNVGGEIVHLNEVEQCFFLSVNFKVIYSNL